MAVKTRITELLKIDHPVIQAGMIWCSGAKLAAAVANAGGLGLIGSGSMKPDLLREHIRKARSLIRDGQFGVNIPLISPYSEELIKVVLEEEVKVAVVAAGSPKKYTSLLKKSGILVGHVVPSAGLARKCETAGVDFVIAEGTEAGGHNSPDEVTTMALIPQVVDAVSIPVVAAGGIGDGRGIAAALALGAEGVQIGTRFAVTAESSASEAYKRAVVNAGETDTILALKKVIPVRLIKTPFAIKVTEAEKQGASREELEKLLGRGRAKAGIFEGDMEEGEIEAGQISGLIDDIPPAGELLRKMMAEAENVIVRLREMRNTDN
jgi:enoyl-[acyl-carrier protein] reductase II